MNTDKYSAVWVSHTSIEDFLKCPRAYYLKNIYRNSDTGNKIKLMSTPLALGQAIHEVIEALSELPVEDRFKEPLLIKYHQAWQKVSGKQGGFTDLGIENEYKSRGEAMLKRVTKNPGPLKNLAVKIKQDLPYFWLSEKDNIILCGKIDWLEYLSDTDSIHVIDFKTSKHDETTESLQLPIYYLIVKNCQRRPVTKTSYWYLERKDKPIEKPLPDPDRAYEKVLDIAKKIKVARQLNVLKCPHKGGCSFCRPYEAVINQEAEFVGTNSFAQDVYVLEKPIQEEESTIL